MINITSDYPFSPKRQAALSIFESELRTAFEKMTADSHPELRDAIHYMLFRLKDRFALSSGWLILQELGVSSTHASPSMCALEMLRCALGTAYSENIQQDVNLSRYIDPKFLTEAILSLMGMTAEIVLSSQHNPELHETEREHVANLLIHKLSPLKTFSKQHHARRYSIGADMSPAELKKIEDHAICPLFAATGSVIDILMGSKGFHPTEEKSFKQYFKHLGLLTYIIDVINMRKNVRLTSSEKLMLIKNLESDLTELASNLEIRDSNVQIVTPLSKLFDVNLQ